MLAKDLYQLLVTTELVTALFDDRIFHMSMPQTVNVFPALTYSQIAQAEIADDMDCSDGSDDLNRANYQFDVISNESEGMIEAADTFDGFFRHFSGTIGTTVIQRIELGNIAHLEQRIGDQLRRRVVLDYSIFF